MKNNRTGIKKLHYARKKEKKSHMKRTVIRNKSQEKLKLNGGMKMKKITSLFLVMGLILAMYAIPTLAAPDSSPCIKVTATYQKYTGGISYAGYNINGYDAYNYKFVAGDRFEYEVYLETNAPGIGYVEIQGSKLMSTDADGNEVHDWKSFRATGAKDGEGIDCHPASDLTELAFQKWYKRSTIIPKSFEGYMTRHIFPMVQKIESTTPVLPTIPEVFYIRNVNIVGSDGKVKLVIFGENERFIASTKVEGVGAKLVLVGENQKTSTVASSALTSSTAKSSTAATSGTVSKSTSTASTIANSTESTLSEEKIESESNVSSNAEISEGSSSKTLSGATSGEKKSSSLPIVIGIILAVLIIGGGIAGFIIMKRKSIK